MTVEAGVKIKRAVGYIRVSTAEQKEEGYSLLGQRKNIELFAEKQGYELIDVYADEGISGKNIIKRPGVQSMLEDAKSGKFDVLIIWKLTRLGRSMKDVMNIAEILYSNNVELHSISESFDITTSTGKMMLGLLANFAEFERSQISENVKMAMKSLVKNNKRFPGGRMLGYRSDRDENGMKILTIEPKEAQVVQMIFSKYLEGNGYRAIANVMNKMGYKTVKGNTFSTIAIKDILMNPTYTGMLRYNRYEDWESKRRKGYNPNYILVEGTHEAIIDKETFGKVEERVKMESKQPQWTHGGENILTGLLRCPECGGAMAASNTTNKLKDGTKKRIRYYSCANFRNKGATVCHANSIRADIAEAFVLDRLREVIAFPENLNKIIDELNQQIRSQRKPWELELQTIEKELVETQTKIDRWHTLLKDTPELSSELSARIEQLEIAYYTHKQRIQELNRILEVEGYKIKKEDTKKVLELVNALIEDCDSKKTTKAILKTFVDRITFDKESKSNFKIYMTFDQVVIDRLNEFMSSEPTANSTAVGSFVLPKILKITV